MTGLSGAFAEIGREIQRRPLVFFLLAIAILVGAVIGAGSLVTIAGQGAFVGEEPTLEQYETSFDRAAIVVFLRADPTEPGVMEAIDRFGSRADDIDNIARVDSPAETVRSEYGYIPESRHDIDAAVGRSGPIAIQVVLRPDLSFADEERAYNDIEEAVEWARFPAGSDVTVTGGPAFESEVDEQINESTQTLIGAAVGLMAVTLYALFGSVRLRLLPLVTVFTAVVYTFGAMGYLGVPNTVLTSSVFPIIIGLGIDYSVQFHERYEEELLTAPPSEALPAALSGVGPPVFVAMLAAGLGFVATWVAAIEIPAFVWFAQTSILGILLSFIGSLLVLLPVLTMYARWRDGVDHDENEATAARSDGGAAAEVSTLGRGLGRVGRTAATNPFAVLLAASLLFTGGLYMSTTLDTLADDEEFVPDDLPALVDLNELREASDNGADVQHSVFVSGGAVTDPATLRWMETFGGMTTDQPLVVDVETPAAALKRHNGGELPRTAAEADRARDRMPPAERNRFFADGHARIVVITQPDLSPRQYVALTANTEAAIETSQPPPSVTAELTGSEVIVPVQTYAQINDRNQITAIGLGLIFLLLFAYYRDPVRAVVPLVPVTFVIGWQGAYMSALGIEVSPLGASLGALVVGIGAEYTIIVMERYFEEREGGMRPLLAVEVAAQRVGKAVSVSGMTTALGFSALALSPFPIVSDFGLLTIGVIGMTLLAVLVVLPAVLILADRFAIGLARVDV